MDSKDRLEPNVPSLPVRKTMAPPALAEASMLPVPAEQSPGPPNLVYAMLRVLAHHWWKILAISGVLTVGLVYAIQLHFKPMYETFSLLRVEPADKDLFGLGLNSAEVFDHFLRTQVELIKSPNVLLAALANRSVAETKVVREASEPESELSGQLQVEIVPGSYFIRVAMTSPDPGESSVIVNEVVKAYLNEATAWSGQKTKFQIESLQTYNRELTDKVNLRKKELLALAAKGNLDLVEPAQSSDKSTLPHGIPNRISAGEYSQVREQLFRVKMDLIEAEALLETRKAEISARDAGMDPGLLLRRQIEDRLRGDPEIAVLLPQIQKARLRRDHVARTSRFQSDPARVDAERTLYSLEKRLRELSGRKREELALQIGEQGPLGMDEGLRELTSQINAMEVRKNEYESLLSKIEVTNRQQGTDAVEVAFVHQDLASLQGMQESVLKRIEQLHFDSRGEARINQISTARAAGKLTSDKRRKLFVMTPVGVIGLVLGLFLFLELRSGRVADLDELSRRVPVEVYAVPSLPGTRRTSDQRALRANEAQLQEFLQSLDHLRVSLWFGKESVPGSGRCVAVTSAIGSEGKTTLAAHLAVCCAKAGISTLVIDADLRRASLSRMFEEEQTSGLSDVLKGDVSPEEAVVALRDGGFHLLPAGSPGQHPGWLFREQRLGQAIARYREMFDLVIIDTPPVLPVADALSLGRWVDGAVLVIRYDVSRFPLVDRARKRLMAAGIPILKTVVNGVKSSRFSSGYSHGYGYSSRYGYGGGDGYGERTAVANPHESSAV
jgi:polysaccharide biosynthesis transport protein